MLYKSFSIPLVIYQLFFVAWILLIGCACYCPLWPCRPMLYDLGSTAHNGLPIMA